MPNRAERRAAERKSQELAAERTQQQPQTLSAAAGAGVIELPLASPEAPSSSPISDRRLAANKANAQLSTGARTLTGKAKSSLNALKTGLTGRSVLLPNDDVAVYEQHLTRHFSEWSPATDREKTLVQFIADTEWRLFRIAPLESAILSVGHANLAEQFADEPNPVKRDALLQLEIHNVYRDDLRNLALQERRLRNQYNRDIQTLETIQQERRENEEKTNQQRLMQVERLKQMAAQALRENTLFDPRQLGFEFSLSELEAFIAANNLNIRVGRGYLNFEKWLTQHRNAQPEAA